MSGAGDKQGHKRRAIQLLDPPAKQPRYTSANATQRSSAHPVKNNGQAVGVQGDRVPVNRVNGAVVAPSSRFEAEVLGGCLWCPPCRKTQQARTQGLPEGPAGAPVALAQSVPLHFANLQHYVDTFEPLLLAEARECILANWAEVVERHGSHQVKVKRVDGGSSCLSVDLQLPAALGAMQHNALLLLSSTKPPQSNTQAWLQGIVEGKGAAHDSHAVPTLLAAAVRGRSGTGGDVAHVTVYPCCSTHAGATAAPCRQAADALVVDSSWWVGYIPNLVSVQREYEALHRMAKLPVLQQLLDPRTLVAASQQLMEPGVIQRCWPLELAGATTFFQTLKQRYDHAQLGAIEFACHHMANPQLQPPAPCVPFVLIQGPPGTGKTHTVRGILNVWHLVHYERRYKRLTQLIEASVRRAANGSNRGLANAEQLEALSAQAPRPQILVTAPSNAAVDELLARVKGEGFTDRAGRHYNPPVLRVGSDTAAGQAGTTGNRDAWVHTLIQGWMQMSLEEWHNRWYNTMQTYQSLVHQAVSLHKEAAANIHDWSLDEVVNMYRNLTPLHDQLAKCNIDRERLSIVELWVEPSKSATGRKPPSREVHDALEESYLREAEMVFTTLSSTGRKIFTRLEGAFEAVLIDEAAQATELATLQPLAFGCKQVVLVGDPQQLPATVISQWAAQHQLNRSLMERLQAASCATQVLTVQYRMHPSIRQFPSEYFYGNRLMDAVSVLNAPHEVYYQHPLLRPYVLFDVGQGQEQRAARGSVRNQAEADLAAALFGTLRGLLTSAAQRQHVPRVTVGVITPYREQVACLQATFVRLLGKSAAAEVMIETVDSFQGKQLDVVILSCVRASGSRKVPQGSGSNAMGFVADIQRMNVAITRARRALWILGNCRTLAANEAWLALIQDAVRRGMVVGQARAADLFPQYAEQLGGQPEAPGAVPQSR